jgi:hypothetical protein
MSIRYQRILVQFWAGAIHFSHLQGIQEGTEANPASYCIHMRALSLGVKQLRCEAAHPPPPSLKLRMIGSIPALPHIPSWHGHGQLYVYFYVYKGASWHSGDRLDYQMVRVQFLVRPEIFSLP